MKAFLIPLLFALHYYPLQAQVEGQKQTLFPEDQSRAKTSVMSDAYHAIWSPEVQEKIDRDIERYRKADARIELRGVPKGTEIKIEQISHDFIFGAHIFNFNQLGSSERNRKYKDVFGNLLNSATIPFYWKKFEMEPGRPRFKEEYWDTEEYWNTVKDPQSQPHWRRPATDPLVEFCEKKGIRPHGHPIVWGITTWHYPEWIFEEFCPDHEKDTINKLGWEALYQLTPKQIAELAPGYTQELHKLFEKRMQEIASYYKGRLKSWDVVNESAGDFHGNSFTGDPISKSVYGLMPGDYTYHAYKMANTVFPEDVLLNINDYSNPTRDLRYTDQVKDLLELGCRIDIVGSQMHLFDPQQCLDIAEGKKIQTPGQVYERMNMLAGNGLPIHLSEVTITSPGDDERGREIQAIIARNLYRLWFSIEPMMGITWWNLVDGCGAPGEPATSGIFTRNMEPKHSFFALNKLINEDWKTNIIVKNDKPGIIEFRGFRGLYRLSWTDDKGEIRAFEYYLK